MASVFTRIIKGELPSYRLYEDEHVVAFLARDAIKPGHTLVVPKIEVDNFVDVPEPYYSAVFRAAKPLAKAIQAATGCARVGTMIVGFEVPHFHYHLVPIEGLHDLEASRAKVLPHEEFVLWQRRIKKALESVSAP